MSGMFTSRTALLCSVFICCSLPLSLSLSLPRSFSLGTDNPFPASSLQKHCSIVFYQCVQRWRYQWLIALFCVYMCVYVV